MTDPFGGVTTYTYDELGRLDSRALPNSVVTTWTFDSRDRLVEIKHVDSTLADTDPNYVIASFTYTHPAHAIGEPHKIMREDGSYIDLVYDASLRIRSETYYSSTATGNIFVREIAYEYDAQGNRTSRIATGLPEELYEIRTTDGYQLARTAGADGVLVTADDAVYTYDDGGRVTGIDRNGDPWTLSYNSAGQPTGVAGIGPANANHTYQYDALGRRVSASDGTDTIHFLIAPAAQRLGAGVLDVEVQHLAANASGNLLAAWVYAGENAILRYGSAGVGSVQYYLEDAIDSIRALVDANRQLVAQYDYDAFGILLDGSDTPTSAAGGDFGYHAAWHDEATGLYHMRARTYDTQTGRFLTPDPADGVPHVPESYNVYAFANSNPHLFSDPTGLFSLTEISASGSISKTLNGLKTHAVQEAKDFIKEKVEEFAVDAIVNLIGRLVPGFDNVDLDALDDLEGAGLSSRLGSMFQDFVQDTVCNAIGAGGIDQYLWIEPIVKRDGKVQRSGINCNALADLPNYVRDLATVDRFTPRPDYIISPDDPKDGGTWLIGDITLSGSGLYRKYISPGRQQGQWKAITNHADNYGLNVSLFVTFKRGHKREYDALAAKLALSGLKKGTLVYVLSLINR